ncbi:MAG TPA: glycosyltransferase [Clostridiales bacterium]|nr:glycosyltransferase [Clostridiales bacterium]
MKPLVSIILPSYNHECYIGKAIKSVLNQTFQDYELLISDDCSTDGTVNVIMQYTDWGIKFHQFSDNQGATINHKYLIEQASGKYIALINSDDVWLPTRLEKQVAYLEDNQNYGACFSWAEFIDENDNFLNEKPNIFKQPNRTQAQWLQYFFTNGNCICLPSMLIRREVYEKLGVYNLALRQLPDFDMWIRLVKKYPIHIIQEPLVLHRRFIYSGENTSSPILKNSVRDVMESYYILTTFFNGLSDELFNEAFSSLFRNKKARQHNELYCEKFFLLLDGKYYMPKVNLLAAINFFIKIYNESDIVETFKNTYNFTLKDFHEISCKIDLYGLLPKDIYIDDSCNINIETYVKNNKLKVLSAMFLRKNSRFYKFLRKIYFASKMNG